MPKRLNKKIDTNKILIMKNVAIILFVIILAWVAFSLHTIANNKMENGRYQKYGETLLMLDTQTGELWGLEVSGSIPDEPYQLKMYSKGVK